MKRLFLIMITFMSFMTVVFALDNDFKNVLTKLEVVKVSDSDYRIDLHTKNSYMSPVKAIKKGENSYNILLPETDNKITTTASGGDIKSIDVRLYPYAGQDIKNGYTKIVITTSKPINITTTVKAEKSTASTSTSEKLAKIDKNLEQIKNDEIPVKQKKNQEVQIKKEENKNQNTLVKISKEDVAKGLNKNAKKAVTNTNEKPKVQIQTETKNKNEKPKQLAQVPQKKEQKQLNNKTKTNISKKDKPVQIARAIKEKPVEKKAVEKPIVAENIENKQDNQEIYAEEQNSSKEDVLAEETKTNNEEMQNLQEEEYLAEELPRGFDFNLNYGFDIKIILASIFALLIIIVLFGKLFKQKKKEKFGKVFTENVQTNKKALSVDGIAPVAETPEAQDATPQQNQEIHKEDGANEHISDIMQETEKPVINQRTFEKIVHNKVEQAKEVIKKDGIEIKDTGFDEENILKEYAQNKEEFSDLSINKLNELKAKRRMEKERLEEKKEAGIKNMRREEERAQLEKERLEALRREQEMVDKARIRREQEKRRKNQEEHLKKHPPMVKPAAPKIQKPEIQLNNDGIDIVNFELDTLQQISEEKEMIQEKSTYEQKEIMPSYEDKKATSELQYNEPPVSNNIKLNNEDNEDVVIFDMKTDAEKPIQHITDNIEQNEAPIIQDVIIEEEQIEPVVDNIEPATNNIEQQEEQEEEEAAILSHIKVEDDRGFYLAEFMQKHSLVGYIGNQIFVIHTFKEPIKNLNIKYRLVDSSIDKDYYVIKIENSKFLIKSTKSELKLELAS